MNNTKPFRILGAAFLLQFVTSFSSGLFIRPVLFPSETMSENLINLAEKVPLADIYILVDLSTALGIIFLGAMLYLALKKQNEKAALVAFGFYILEAALLAASRLATFSLIGLSQEYVRAGNPADLLLLGNLAFESMDFVGSTLHILAFLPGALLFYYLLYQSRAVPRALSLYGLITLLPLLIGTLTAIFGYELPFVLFVPYVPFEFVIGIWILIKGVPRELARPA